MINGKSLIKLGYKPSKWFGKIIKELNDLNITIEEDIRNYIETNAPKEVLPFTEPQPYIVNLKASNKDEELNFNAVISTMNEVMKTPTVVNGVLMPDACPTGELGQIPVGAVVVTKGTIHPAMHSSDVCCSVMTTNLGKIDPKTVLDIAMQTTKFGAGGRKEHDSWANLLYDNKILTKSIEENYFTKDYIQKAAMHLGTQGDGNHFLFVGISENTGDTHLVTHHGSRGFGASVYKKGMDSAEKYRKELSPKTLKRNAWIPFNTKEGKLYWEALQIVRDWTKLNHESIHNEILNKLKINIVDRFWNEHNFVFKDEEDNFYHAKGATPLDNKFVPDSTNGLRLIPLNMSQPVLVVKGESNSNNLGFAPHGAGRNLSRGEYKRRNTNKTTEQIFKEETEGLDIRFFSGITDISELPSAYKNASYVQDQMKEFDLGEIVDRIIPYGCIMAGEQVPFWKNNKNYE